MAEDYKSTVRATGPQALNLTNIKEAQRASSSLENRLSQASQIIFKDLVGQKAREGEEFAVKNQVSVKQVAAAVEKGEDVRKLFAQPGTVFGDSAKTLQAELFRQEVSQDLDRNVAAVLTSIDRGTYDGDPNDYANAVQAEIDGIANVLGDIDPKSAVKFKAHGATLTNTVYEKLLNKQTEKIVAEKEAAVESTATAYSTILSANLVKSKGDFAEAVALSMSVKQDLFDAYEALPGGMNDKHLSDVMALEQETYKNATLSIIQSSPALRNDFDGVYQKLILNTPPEDLDFYKFLPEQTKLEIIDTVQNIHTQQYTVEQKQYDREKRNATARLNTLENQYTRLISTTDTLDPNRDQKLAEIDKEVEELVQKHPSHISMESWRKFKRQEYEGVNEFDPDASDIRRMIKKQRFADIEELTEHVMLNYPNKFPNKESVRITFGKLYDKTSEKYIDEAAYDIVVQVAPAGYTQTDRRNMKDGLVRRIENQIQENKDINAENPDAKLSTNAREIAQSIVAEQEQLNLINNDISTLLTSMQTKLNNVKLNTINVTETLELDDTLKAALKKKLKKDYDAFIAEFNKMKNKVEESKDIEGIF